MHASVFNALDSIPHMEKMSKFQVSYTSWRTNVPMSSDVYKVSFYLNFYASEQYIKMENSSLVPFSFDNSGWFWCTHTFPKAKLSGSYLCVGLWWIELWASCLQG